MLPGKTLTKGDLEENLLNLQGAIHNHRTPWQELKDGSRNHREAPLTGLQAVTCSTYFLI